MDPLDLSRDDRDRQHRLLVARNGSDDPREPGADAEPSRVLAVDDRVGGVPDAVVYPRHHIFGQRRADLRREGGDWDRACPRRRPGEDLAVAALTKNVGVDRLRRDAEVAGREDS